jgi:hypothetical protein
MPRINWYHPARGGRGPESSTGAVVSYLPGVRAAVMMEANGLASDAWIQLLWHRQTGAASVKVVGPPTTELDAHVVLHDRDPGGEGIGGKNKHKRSAMSIELGWHQNNAFGIEGREAGHPGLHILDGVMKRAIRKYGGG